MRHNFYLATNKITKESWNFLELILNSLFFSLNITADFVKTCYLDQPGFVNCSTHAVQNLFNQLPIGVPEIELESLDPLYVPKVKVIKQILFYYYVKNWNSC